MGGKELSKPSEIALSKNVSVKENREIAGLRGMFLKITLLQYICQWEN